MRNIFERRGIELTFEDLQYSPEGILTAITARFQNKKTGQSGIFTKNKTTGIPSFEVYVNDKNETGFRTVKEESDPTSAVMYRDQSKIGDHPLYILNGKIYSDKDLKGRTIKSAETIEVLIPEYAVKKYGIKGKDGAIIIKNGEIMEDGTVAYSSKKKGEYPESNFVSIDDEGKPVFIHINKSTVTYESKGSGNVSKNSDSDWAERAVGNEDFYPSSTGSTTNLTVTNNGKTTGQGDSDTVGKGINSKDATKVFSGKKSPLIVIDGVIKKADFDANLIDPNTIQQINVLKDKSATEKYGKKGKNGVIEIHLKTRNDKENNNSDGYFLIGIKKTSTDAELEKIKLNFNKNGLIVTFEELKRDNNGMITHLKISARNESRNASATFDVNSGIPDVFIGQRDKEIIISSNPPR